nr:MAG TPA: Repressor protein CI [Caudoviricetes sp.]
MEHLKKIREAKGLLQKDVATVLGVDRTTYVKYERGDSDPGKDNIVKLANFFGVSTDYILEHENKLATAKKGVEIPVLGKVVAGIPIDAIEEIIDYEEITPEMASQGEHFGLTVKGDSMEPKFSDGDVVIVRKQSDVDTGDIAVVLVNGNEATLKKLKKRPDGIMLIPTNPQYEVMFYNNTEIENLPVSIIGKVVELRAKF